MPREPTAGSAAATGVGAALTIQPGMGSQLVADAAPISENGKRLGQFTFTVDGNQPNGGIICEAMIVNSNGRDEQRFVVPGL